MYPRLLYNNNTICTYVCILYTHNNSKLKYKRKPRVLGQQCLAHNAA